MNINQFRVCSSSRERKLHVVSICVRCWGGFPCRWRGRAAIYAVGGLSALRYINVMSILRYHVQGKEGIKSTLLWKVKNKISFETIFRPSQVWVTHKLWCPPPPSISITFRIQKKYHWYRFFFVIKSQIWDCKWKAFPVLCPFRNFPNEVETWNATNCLLWVPKHQSFMEAMIILYNVEWIISSTNNLSKCDIIKVGETLNSLSICFWSFGFI